MKKKRQTSKIFGVILHIEVPQNCVKLVFSAILYLLLCSNKSKKFLCQILSIRRNPLLYRNKKLVELDQADAERLNTFVDAGITVYMDDVPVSRVTAEIVDDVESIRIGDDNYGIEPLLEDGYVMLVNGVLEPADSATMDSILAYYYPYEVKIENKIIVLKEK